MKKKFSLPNREFKIFFFGFITKSYSIILYLLKTIKIKIIRICEILFKLLGQIPRRQPNIAPNPLDLRYKAQPRA